MTSTKNVLYYDGNGVILLYDKEEGKWIHVFVKAGNSLFVKRSLHVEELLDFSIEAYKKFIEEYTNGDVFIEDEDDILDKIKAIEQYIKKLKDCKRKLKEELERFK